MLSSPLHSPLAYASHSAVAHSLGSLAKIVSTDSSHDSLEQSGADEEVGLSLGFPPTNLVVKFMRMMMTRAGEPSLPLPVSPRGRPYQGVPDVRRR
jgi:hypothetical protein